MLQGEAREDSVAPKKNKKEPSIVKTEAERIENYSNLIYQIVSELGFLIPDISHEHDPLRRKYQPSLKHRGTRLIYILFNNGNFRMFEGLAKSAEQNF